jgi:hypothetical protein
MATTTKAQTLLDKARTRLLAALVHPQVRLQAALSRRAVDLSLQQLRADNEARKLVLAALAMQLTLWRCSSKQSG